MKSLLVKLRIVLIWLIIFGYAEAWGADWKYIGKAYQGMYFYDAGSMRRSSEGIVKVWIKVLYTEEGVNYMVKLLGRKYETLSYAIILFEYRCGDKVKQIVPIAFYSGDGKVLISADNRTSDWNSMSPDSIDEALYKILCK